LQPELPVLTTLGRSRFVTYAVNLHKHARTHMLYSAHKANIRYHFLLTYRMDSESH